MRILTTLLMTMSLANVTIWAQNNDIMLNASSDSKPREISLGLPTNSYSAVQIFEDGLPVSYYKYQLFPYKSWHGGVSALTPGKMNPMETSLRYGEINTFIDSYNKYYSDSINTTLAYTAGTFGQHKIDFNISGSIPNAKIGFSLSTFQNIDPGSNHIKYPKYKDRHQFYKGVFSKVFTENKGYLSLTYQHVDYISVAENYGPFIFVGDGSVKQIDGFDLGRDCYLPDFKYVTIHDFLNGEIKKKDIKDSNRDKTNHISLYLKYIINNKTTLSVRSRYKNGTSNREAHNLGSIINVTEKDGYTKTNKQPYTGLVQLRALNHYESTDKAWMNNAEMQFKGEKNLLLTGFDYHFNRTHVVGSSTNYAHEVTRNPHILFRNGEDFYNFNTSGEYYEGDENKFALYVKDDMYLFSRLSLESFFRSEVKTMNGKSANNKDDNDHTNDRVAGFNLSKGRITKFDETFINGAIGFNLNLKLTEGLSFRGEGIITKANNSTFDYGGYKKPDTDPSYTKFLQMGFAFSRKKINIVSQLVYISQDNQTSRTMFQHELTTSVGENMAGYKETVMKPVKYGIQSIGWTTDAIINISGFSLHSQVIIRNPQYKDFIFSPTFSDGVTEHYDFSNNNVTNLHKVEIALDPSYTVSNWHFWLSGRYISKQYINKTNSLYFKERIETFGGVDYQIKNNYGTVSLNVINILNQKGASGAISAADLIEETSGYHNYQMAGTFIRPFTVELSLKLSL
ncbi:MAG: hypothetical protein HUJ96_00480 [Marinilabiliaceae bacterium]|nr:hypothetical protein [Marinilabiliaceae bacterium]